MHLASQIFFAAGSLICHQRPERSFFWGEHQFPVCARCTGLYLSAALGVIAWIAIKTTGGWRRCAIDLRTARAWFIAAAMPTLLSLASGMLGVWDGSNITRAMLAIPLGAAAGVIVAAVATKDLR
jgi:uncharacterized membrane protein